jgi:hypothetical protein
MSFWLKAVKAQQNKWTTETYMNVSGYDVNGNFSAPLTTAFTVIPAIASAVCVYACSMNASCYFVVLKLSSSTCSLYSQAARTSVYASTGSTIYQRKING